MHSAFELKNLRPLISLRGANFVSSMRLTTSRHWRLRLETVLSPSREIEKGNTAFASTTNTDSALYGKKVQLMKSKSPTTTKKSDLLPLITPGEILAEEFLAPLALSVNALSIALRVPATRIQAIVKGKRAITADTALRLGRYFGMSAQFWMNLQSLHDLEKAKRESLDQIEIEVRQRPAA